jgi:hypothetical protein
MIVYKKEAVKKVNAKPIQTIKQGIEEYYQMMLLPTKKSFR